jgi:hypothetical protein
MSHHMTSAVFQCFYDGGNVRLIALALADACVDETGEGIFLAVDTLAQMADVNRSTVQRTVAKLLADRWLLRPGGNVGGRGRTNTYNINPEWVTAVAVERARARQAGQRAGKVLPPVRPDDAGGQKGDNLSPFSGAVHGPVDESVKGGNLPPFSKPERVANSTIKGGKNGLKGGTAMPPEQEQNTLTAPLPPSTGGERDFEQLESEYPRQDVADRVAAHRVWRKLAPNAQRQGAMLVALRAMKASAQWQADGGRWVPKLSRWLRGWLVGDGPPQLPGPEPVHVATPLPPRVVLTPEQLAANKARAREAVAAARGAGRGGARAGAAPCA